MIDKLNLPNFDINHPRNLEDDRELLELMRKYIRFKKIEVASTEAMDLDLNTLITNYDEMATKLGLLQAFIGSYSATGQDTVTFAPEFFVVARNIIDGKRPTKLAYLTDFEGEQK